MAYKFFASRLVQAAIVAGVASIVSALISASCQRKTIQEGLIIQYLEIESQQTAIVAKHRAISAILITLKDYLALLSERTEIKAKRDFYREQYEKVDKELKEQIRLTTLAESRLDSTREELRQFKSQLARKDLASLKIHEKSTSEPMKHEPSRLDSLSREIAELKNITQGYSSKTERLQKISERLLETIKKTNEGMTGGDIDVQQQLFSLENETEQLMNEIKSLRASK